MKKRILVTLTLVLALLLSLSALVIGASASGSEPQLKVESGALALEDSVEMLFLVSYDGVAPEDVELLIWTGSDVKIAECVKGTEERTLTSQEYNTNTKQIVFRFKGLAAAEMTKNVYVKVYAEGTYSEPFKYSIAEYAYNMLNKDTTAPALKQVLIDMLVYGASAQNYFNTGDGAPLASSDFAKVILSGATFADGMTHELLPVGSTVTLTAPVTAELPYVIWTNEKGEIISVDTVFEYTVSAGDNKLFANLTDTQSSFGLYEHVVIIGVDGAGAFPTSTTYNTSTPNIDRIFADGAVTRTMRVASPTSSAASWGAMLHGSLPYQNGIFDNAPVEDSNASYPIDSKFPSFLKHLVDTDSTSKVAVFSGWSGITNGILEEDNASGIYQQRKSDADNLADVKNYINANRDFKAIFYQINNPDAMGHNYDYISEQYYKAIETADQQIGQVYAALEAAGILDKTLFIVTADHGGTSRLVSGNPNGTGTHGGLSDVEKYTMLAVAGHTVDSGATPADAHIRDIASIALYALGVTQPESYSSRVPTGVFAGVEAGERPVYNDPDNSRDYISSPTPEYTGDNFKVGGVDNQLWYYLPFDNSIEELVNDDTTSQAVGTVSYEQGYFGEAVVLDDGHVVMDNFATGTESFSVSMWVKSAGPEGVPPIVASRNRATDTNRGFLVAMRRTATAQKTDFTLEWSFSNGVGAPDSYTKPYYMPDDFSRGWMHIVVVFDKEKSEISVATDFGEITTWSSPTHLTPGADLTNELRQLVFGDDLSQNYSSKMGLSIDEFMIFHGALDRNDINRLAEYYGQKGVPTIYDELGFDPTVNISFNGNVTNNGTNSTTFNDTNMSYVDSPFGEAADFTSVDQNKKTPEHWANSSNAQFSTAQPGGGYNDLTFNFWLALGTDMIKYHDDGTAFTPRKNDNDPGDYTSDNGAQTWSYGDRILMATQDYSGWKNTATTGNDGMNVFLYSKPAKIKAAELPSYMSADDFTADASGCLMYKSGEFAGEYIYCQRLTIRFRVTVDGKMYTQQTAFNFYAAIGEWTQITMVIDRGDYGQDNAELRVYQDGQMLSVVASGVEYYDNAQGKFVKPDVTTWGNKLVGEIADYCAITYSKGFMLNDDVGHYDRDMESYLDEFTVFDRALTEEDIAKLLAYYESIKD